MKISGRGDTSGESAYQVTSDLASPMASRKVCLFVPGQLWIDHDAIKSVRASGIGIDEREHIAGAPLLRGTDVTKTVGCERRRFLQLIGMASVGIDRNCRAVPGFLDGL